MILNATAIIADKVNELVENWEDGESHYLTIYLDDLGMEECLNLESQIEDILSNVGAIESHEIKCGELILEVSHDVLKEAFDERMKMWRNERIVNDEYYGRRAI